MRISDWSSDVCSSDLCQQGSGACHDWPLAPRRQDRRGRCCRCACGRNHPRPSCGERAEDEGQMIAKLKGLLDSTGTDHAIIDVQGVGYLVGASSRTLAALGRTGEACTVSTTWEERRVGKECVSKGI